MFFVCVAVCIFECKTSTVCINDCAYVGVNFCLALVVMLPQYLEDEKTALSLQCRTGYAVFESMLLYCLFV